MDLATIAQTVSAIGTVLLAALFGYQVTVFKKQVAVNRGTLDEMREGRIAHERPQVVVTAEYRHGTLVEVVTPTSAGATLRTSPSSSPRPWRAP